MAKEVKDIEVIDEVMEEELAAEQEIMDFEELKEEVIEEMTFKDCIKAAGKCLKRSKLAKGLAIGAAAAAAVGGGICVAGKIISGKEEVEDRTDYDLLDHNDPE